MRRVESIDAAHVVLKRAEARHPNDATIQFNLACYEAQLGNLGQAKVNLERATRIDPKFRLTAMEDTDLEPIWISRRTENELNLNPQNRSREEALNRGLPGPHWIIPNPLLSRIESAL